MPNSLDSFSIVKRISLEIRVVFKRVVLIFVSSGWQRPIFVDERCFHFFFRSRHGRTNSFAFLFWSQKTSVPSLHPVYPVYTPVYTGVQMSIPRLHRTVPPTSSYNPACIYPKDSQILDEVSRDCADQIENCDDSFFDHHHLPSSARQTTNLEYCVVHS